MDLRAFSVPNARILLPESGHGSEAIAQCGIARTRDLVTWHLPSDLRTKSPQQRNVVLHPEYIDGQYAFYTRPQDSFIEAGLSGGIGPGGLRPHRACGSEGGSDYRP